MGARTTAPVSVTDTTYDACGCSPMGKVTQQSMPHADAATQYLNVYVYDGIGRMISATAPGNAGSKVYEYYQNTVKITDEALKWKKYYQDVLGNLVQVDEPNPGGGTYTTTYTYDVLNHLTDVSMTRDGTLQTRRFDYGTAPGVRLLSATNPENGQTDAKNQQTQYSYDATYKRVTQVRHYPVAGGAEDLCQQVNLYYGTNPFDLFLFCYFFLRASIPWRRSCGRLGAIRSLAGLGGRRGGAGNRL